MKTLLSSPLKAGLAALCLAGMLSVPAVAGPAPVNAPAGPAASVANDLIQVRDHRWRRAPPRHWSRHHYRENRRWRRHHYRPYYHRPHYRGSGFYLGLGLGVPAYRYVEPRRYYRPAGNAHVRWCYNRYRSYRAWDNTFQPYYGPRRQCRSPYG